MHHHFKAEGLIKVGSQSGNVRLWAGKRQTLIREQRTSMTIEIVRGHFHILQDATGVHHFRVQRQHLQWKWNIRSITGYHDDEHTVYTSQRLGHARRITSTVGCCR